MTLARRCLVLALATVGLAGSALASSAQAAAGDPFQRACRTSVNSAPIADCVPNVRGLTRATALSPDGRHLYVSVLTSGANTFTGIQLFNRDPSTGALSQPANSCWSAVAFEDCTVVPGLSWGYDMRLDPDGETLYLASAGADTLFAFDRSSSSGALDPLPCFGSAAGCTALTPLSGVLAVVASDSNVYLRVNGGLFAFSRDDAGELTQEACYVETAQAPCTDVVGLASAGYKLDLAPDGNHLYVPFTSPGGVGVFEVLDSGLLNQDLGTVGGCVSSTGASGGTGSSCVDGNDALATAYSTEVSPDGKNVYVGSNGGIVAFNRNGSSGLLTERDCVVENPGPAGCDDGAAVFATFDMEVTEDGKSLLSSAIGVAGIAFFSRDTNTGAITQAGGGAGCMTNNGSGGLCQTRGQLGGIARLEAAPNSLQFYVTGDSTGLVGTFEIDRAPVCPSRSVSAGHNTPTGVSLACTDANGDAITYSITRAPASGLTGAVDQGAASVLYTPNNGFTGGDSFQYKGRARDADSNTATINVSVAAAPPPPPPPPPPPARLSVVRSTTTFDSLTFPNFTKIVNLRANRVPANATVTVTCKTKKKSQQRRCPKRKRYRTRRAVRRLNLRKPFANRRLPPGTKITIQINATGFRGKRIIITIRDDARPVRRVQCLNERNRPGSCV
jgi:hypothetical protein